MLWNIDGNFAQTLTDASLRIPPAHLSKVCKRSQGSCACRYISWSLHLKDFVCVKNSPLKKYIDLEVKSNKSWKAQGNNCDGFGQNYGKKKQEHEENKENKEKE